MNRIVRYLLYPAVLAMMSACNKDNGPVPVALPKEAAADTVVRGEWESAVKPCAWNTDYVQLLSALTRHSTGPSLALVLIRNEDTGEVAGISQTGWFLGRMLAEIRPDLGEDIVPFLMQKNGTPIEVPKKLYDRLTERELPWTEEHRQVLARGRMFVVENYMEEYEDGTYYWDSDRFGPEFTADNSPIVRLLLAAGIDVAVSCLSGGIHASYVLSEDENTAAYHEGQVIARIAGGILTPSPEHLPLMIRYLEDDSSKRWAHVHIVRILRRMGPAARPALDAVVEHLEWCHYCEASDLHTLMCIDAVAAEPVPLLVRALVWRKLSHTAQDWVVERLGEEATSALDALTGRLRTTWFMHRPGVARAIWLITDNAELVLPALTEVLDNVNNINDGVPEGLRHLDYDGQAARDAIWLLKEMGVAAAPAVAPLRRLLWADYRLLRSSAAEVLGAIGPAASAAIPDLLRLIGGEDEIGRSVVESAVDALRSLGAPEEAVVPALIDIVRDCTKGVALRTVAVEKLGERAAAAAEAVPVLTEAARTGGLGLRLTAIETLGRIGPPSASAIDVLAEIARAEAEAGPQPTFLEGIYESTYSARLAVAKAMWRITGEVDRSVPALLEALRSPVDAWRSQAASMLEEIGPPAIGAVSDLENYADYEREYEEEAPYAAAVPYGRRVHVAGALWSITRDPARVLPYLTGALERGESWDKVAAARFLSKMGEPALPAVDALRVAAESGDEEVREAVAEALRFLQQAGAGQGFRRSDLTGSD